MENKNKYIKRSWLKTGDGELMESTIGYVNKDFGTIQIRISDEESITIDAKDVKINDENDMVIGIKEKKSDGSNKISVYNFRTKEKSEMRRDAVVDLLIKKGFKPSIKYLTVKEKLELLK